jgi:hypothetical protein
MTITAPAAGKVIVSAQGLFDNAAATVDEAACEITTGLVFDTPVGAHPRVRRGGRSEHSTARHDLADLTRREVPPSRGVSLHMERAPTPHIREE